MIFVYIVTILTVLFGTTAAAVVSCQWPASIRMTLAVILCILPTMIASLILLWAIRQHDSKDRRTVVAKVVGCHVVCLLASFLIVPFRVASYLETREHAREIRLATECRLLLRSLREYAQSHDANFPDTLTQMMGDRADANFGTVAADFTFQRPTAVNTAGPAEGRDLLVSREGLLDNGMRIVGLDNGEVGTLDRTGTRRTIWRPELP